MTKFGLMLGRCVLGSSLYSFGYRLDNFPLLVLGLQFSD